MAPDVPDRRSLSRAFALSTSLHLTSNFSGLIAKKKLQYPLITRFLRTRLVGTSDHCEDEAQRRA